MIYRNYKYVFVQYLLSVVIVMNCVGNLTAQIFHDVYHLNPKTYHIDYDDVFINQEDDGIIVFSNIPSHGPKKHNDFHPEDFRYTNNDGGKRTITVPSRLQHPKAYKRALSETKNRIKKHGQYFEAIETTIASNDQEKADADKSGDLIERFAKRVHIISRSKKGAESALRMRERVSFYDTNFGLNEKPLDKDEDFYNKKVQKYIDHKNDAIKDLKAIVSDINKKFDEFANDMAPNDGQIKAADETDDPHERLRARADILGKSDRAASFTEKFAKAVKELKKADSEKKSRAQKIDVKDHEKNAEAYRNYEKKIADNFYDIEKDVITKFNQIHEAMSSNNEDIKNADASNHLYTRFHVRKGIIEKSKNAADHLEKYINMANQWHGNAYGKIKHHPEWDLNRFRNLAKMYRDYQKKVEKDLGAIEEDIKKEDREREGKNFRRREERDEKEKKEARDREDERVRQEAERERKRREQEEKDREENERLKEEERIRQEQAQKETQERDDKVFEGEINQRQVGESLNSLNKMFNGEMAPSMEAFHEIKSAFDGNEFDEREVNIGDGFGSDIEGDYAMAVYEYRDEKYGVKMDIGRMSKFKNGEIDFDNYGKEGMDIRGISVTRERKISFAISGEDERVMIESDIDSIENIIAQRKAEAMVFLQVTPDLPKVNLEQLKIWGVEEESPNSARWMASLVADFIPFVGTAKGINELIYGYDFIAGEEVNRVVAACGLILSAVGGKAVGTLGGKFIIKNGKVIGQEIKYLGKNINKLLFKVPAEFIEAGYTGGTKYFVKSGEKIVHVGEVIKKLKPEVQEQLKHMKIPDKALVPNGGLINREYLGGHVIEKHVGKNYQEMYNRMILETQERISSFKNLEEAEYFVAETIKANQRVINEWLRIAKKTKKIELPFTHPTGFLVKEGNKAINEVYKVRVILVPGKKHPGGYKILTAFPIE